MLIKPIREASLPVMLMFTSIDRPEDRPHTLRLAMANVVPGMLISLGMLWLFKKEGNSHLMLVRGFLRSFGLVDAETRASRAGGRASRGLWRLYPGWLECKNH
jgi:hypothetical protein